MQKIRKVAKGILHINGGGTSIPIDTMVNHIAS